MDNCVTMGSHNSGWLLENQHCFCCSVCCLCWVMFIWATWARVPHWLLSQMLAWKSILRTEAPLNTYFSYSPVNDQCNLNASKRTPLGLLNSWQEAAHLRHLCPAWAFSRATQPWNVWSLTNSAFHLLAQSNSDHQQADTNCSSKMFWKIVTLMSQ